MPEIAESMLMKSRAGSIRKRVNTDNLLRLVARAVHFLRLHLVGKTIKTATAIEDANVFGKVGTSGPEFAAAMTGKKVCVLP